LVAIGVDVGGTNIRLVAIDSGFQILTRKSAPLPFERNIESVTSFVSDYISNCNFGLPIYGVGIAITGVLGPSGLLQSSNIGEINNLPVYDIIRSKLPQFVLLDNDVRCALRGEYHLGVGRGFSDIFCITLGTGLGGSAIIDGRLRCGPHNIAGEVGMTCFSEPKSRQLFSLESRWKALRASFRETLFDHKEAVKATCNILAAAVVNVYYVLEVEIIILGGLSTMFGATFIEDINLRIGKMVGRELEFNARMTLAGNGIYSGAIGAACLILENFDLLPRL
jgi:predicted NBD/HSP70 family sugar kinase